MPHFLFTATAMVTPATAPVEAVAPRAAFGTGSGGHVC